MIVDCISDLHGHYPELQGGDLLIVAGDLTRRDTVDEYDAFFAWLSVQNYEKAILVAGNHDNLLEKGYRPFLELDRPLDISIQYLCDSRTEFEDLKIWGSPWTKRFWGMNPDCMAFTVKSDEELAEKWTLIPDDTDILITHSPPQGIMDKSSNEERCGSESLLMRASQLKNLKLFVWGHIHEGYGIISRGGLSHLVNASHMNQFYDPVNKPIRVIL